MRLRVHMHLHLPSHSPLASLPPGRLARLAWLARRQLPARAAAISRAFSGPPYSFASGSE
jgi:hypothetical protein